MLEGWLSHSILKRAVDSGVVEIRRIDIRDFTTDRHRTADDTLCGGGPGMLLKAGPVVQAVGAALAASIDTEADPAEVILLTPIGETLSQALLEDLATKRHFVLICGRYEGVDERVRELVVTREVSLGDFVLTGGELAAAALVDGVVRLVPGALGKDESSHDESFSSGLLEYPQYTRPVAVCGRTVPPILLGGNHQEVQRWRTRQALLRTLALRPDLLPPDWRDQLRKPSRRQKQR